MAAIVDAPSESADIFTIDAQQGWIRQNDGVYANQNDLESGMPGGQTEVFFNDATFTSQRLDQPLCSYDSESNNEFSCKQLGDGSQARSVFQTCQFGSLTNVLGLDTFAPAMSLCAEATLIAEPRDCLALEPVCFSAYVSGVPPARPDLKGMYVTVSVAEFNSSTYVTRLDSDESLRATFQMASREPGLLYLLPTSADAAVAFQHAITGGEDDRVPLRFNTVDPHSEGDVSPICHINPDTQAWTCTQVNDARVDFIYCGGYGGIQPYFGLADKLVEMDCVPVTLTASREKCENTAEIEV